MRIQTLLDIGDVVICPEERIEKSIKGIVVRNDKGNIQIAYQFEGEYSWHMQEEIMSVDDEQ